MPTTTSTTLTTTRSRRARGVHGYTLPKPVVASAVLNAGGAGYDFRPMLERLHPVLDTVDLAVCHLETPIAPAGEELSTAPTYGVPAEIADALVAAGYDRCSTASNHSLDRGTAGVDRTVGTLESVGIEQSGMARTAEEIAPRVFDVAGVAVSHLSYTFSYNGLRTTGRGLAVGIDRPVPHRRRRLPGAAARRRDRDRQPPLGRRGGDGTD